MDKPLHPEQRLESLRLTLPVPPPTLAHYELAVRTGDLLFLAGHAPLLDGEHQYVGKVGREWTEAEGYDAARLTALNMLATLKAELGDLRRMHRVVKLLGMVNCAESGCSSSTTAWPSRSRASSRSAVNPQVSRRSGLGRGLLLGVQVLAVPEDVRS